MTVDPKTLHITSDLCSFFEAEISQTATKQGVDLSADVKKYLATVLSNFGNTENLINKDEGTGEENDFPALAMMWLESVGMDTFAQISKLKRMGDIALFTSGFLGGRIARSLVDMDYYMAMGESAYEKVGQLSNSLAQEEGIQVYFELSSRFPQFVEIFSELSEQSLLTNDTDILKLYQRWANTQSGRLARMLSEAGIVVGKHKG